MVTHHTPYLVILPWPVDVAPRCNGWTPLAETVQGKPAIPDVDKRMREFAKVAPPGGGSVFILTR
jgi:hypothetical protein